ncbi:MAG: C69 family dipeptidase [Melioribacteraceae bacterium]|nr:C69 family dipeptidase [Melioribacteraceae bacterium]MCF8352854.1 C69 family dipeptidase [Melioribacteraceae bacterium]MCF8417371.1 C69 family dipeptidase [Melioribacteraceae bacterium]
MSAIVFLFITYNLYSQNIPDWEGGIPDGCTSITVGKSATSDGSVITSHTCDSHRTRGYFDIMPAKNYNEGEMVTMKKRTTNDSLAMPAYKHIPVGEIPQVENTFGYINTAYPSMNQYQLAIGESTFGGRSSLKSDKGLIDCQQLCRLMLERCKTAREAIQLAGDLLAEYGWNDYGETLTIADKNEVWMLEIVGPGKNKIGAVWAAQRIPDDHISVTANASRIRQIDLHNSDYFIASDNIYSVAQDSSWWSESDGPFEFCYAYAPGGRTSYACRRREWRVLSLAAPSLGLHPDSENFPFSVKPDSLITKEKLVEIFQDYYQDTDFLLTKNITTTDDSGRTVLSPFANPFMPYDMRGIFNINGGWGWRGERSIAQWYTMYATITQSREWLPDEIGGVVWLAWDNVATSIYVPVYCSVSDVAESFKTQGRINGFNRQSAWWAFNRLGTLTAQRWGDMIKDVKAVWSPLQKKVFSDTDNFEKELLEVHKNNPDNVSKMTTRYGIKWGDKVVKKAWELGDYLWTKYDEKF